MSGCLLDLLSQAMENDSKRFDIKECNDLNSQIKTKSFLIYELLKSQKSNNVSRYIKLIKNSKIIENNILDYMVAVLMDDKSERLIQRRNIIDNCDLIIDNFKQFRKTHKKSLAQKIPNK